MNHKSDLLLDYDKVADVLYVVRAGYDLDVLINEDSEKIPGFVKRIDPASRECVGFMIYSFSVRFPKEVEYEAEHLKTLMDFSLKLTNEKPYISEAKAA